MRKKIASIGIILLVLLGLFGLGKQISKALEAGHRLDKAADNLNKLQQENRELQNRLVQVQRLEFIEEQARNKLNLAKKGETIVVIPQEEIDKVLGLNKKVKEIKLPNWQGWLKLILH